MVIADQLRYTSCGYAGDSTAVTPNIDSLAAEGMSFDNYVVNTPEQAATQATLWTGKYTSTHGLIIGPLQLNPNHDALGYLLTAKGYMCDYIGRWQLWANVTGPPDLREENYCPPGPYRLGFDGLWATSDFNQNYGNQFLVRHTSDRIQIRNSDSQRHSTDLAIERVQQHAKSKQPFAMVVAYGAWVDTQTRSNEAERPEDTRAQASATTIQDEQIGRLLRAVEDSGLSHNTIVMLTSGQAARFDASNQNAKMMFLDTCVRVPMLIR